MAPKRTRGHPVAVGNMHLHDISLSPDDLDRSSRVRRRPTGGGSANRSPVARVHDESDYNPHSTRGALRRRAPTVLTGCRSSSFFVAGRPTAAEDSRTLRRGVTKLTDRLSNCARNQGEITAAAIMPRRRVGVRLPLVEAAKRMRGLHRGLMQGRICWMDD